MPALCSATYFYISSYVALISADVTSISSSSYRYINVIIWLLFQLGQKNNRFHMCSIPKLIHRPYLAKLISALTKHLKIPR